MSGREGNFKKQQLAERIQNSANTFLKGPQSNSYLNLLSITRVELNVDNSVATLYWDTFDSGKRGDIKAALESAKGKLRTQLTHTLKLRKSPIINLVYDSQYEDEMKITELINKSKSEGSED